MSVTHADRRNATSAEKIWSIEDGVLTAQEGERVVHRVPLDRVTQVRLALEMAGKEVQVVCRVSVPGEGEAVFGSQSWAGVGQWNNRAQSFRALLGELHTALMPRRDEIRFLEGQSLAFRWIMTAFGAVMAVIGAAIAVFLLAFEENTAGFFAVAPAVTGGWIAWLFRPRAPKPYDPATYAKVPS
ncbi:MULTISPECIES: hypothetical protein [Hyphobacterium]|uniref:DUF2335 domain-containing protein n=1 Tax=Hyphobacterium vulgare TaxID=1736751 RepID=A0ABV6ZXE7_9PROT